MRVLLVDDDLARAATLCGALAMVGCHVVGRLPSGQALLAEVRRLKPDLLIVDTASPDRDTLEHLCVVSRDEPRPIVLFTHDDNDHKMRMALRAGVSAYVVQGYSPERVRAVIALAVARFEQHQTWQHDLTQARTELVERKAIERAKGLLMQARGLTEQEAYGLLRKAAMQRGKRVAELAEGVLAAEDLLRWV